MSAGLQTHIWNNNLVSGLVIFLIPLTYIALLLLGLHLHDLLFDGRAGQESFTPIISATCLFYAVFIPIFMQWTEVAFRLATQTKPLQRRNHPDLFALLEPLCIQRGMTTPGVYLLDIDAPNVLSFGLRKNNMLLGITKGFLSNLTPVEQRAALAQELYQIRSNDTRLLTLVYVFTLPIRLIATYLLYALFYLGLLLGARSLSAAIIRVACVILFFVGIILSFDYMTLGLFQRADIATSPLTVLLLQATYWLLFVAALRAVEYALFALLGTQKRELVADAESIKETKDPDALISALRKIDLFTGTGDSLRDLNHLFVVNPLGSTHPSLRRRIASLQEITGQSA